MAEPCAAVEYALSYPLEKSAPGAVALLHPGADTLEMILGDAVLLLDADHQGDGASAAAAAGLFQEIDADIGLLPERRTVSAQDPSHDRGVVPGLMRGNEDLGKLIYRLMLWLQKSTFL